MGYNSSDFPPSFLFFFLESRTICPFPSPHERRKEGCVQVGDNPFTSRHAIFHLKSTSSSSSSSSSSHHFWCPRNLAAECIEKLMQILFFYMAPPTVIDLSARAYVFGGRLSEWGVWWWWWWWWWSCRPDVTPDVLFFHRRSQRGYPTNNDRNKHGQSQPKKHQLSMAFGAVHS